MLMSVLAISLQINQSNHALFQTKIKVFIARYCALLINVKQNLYLSHIAV